MFTKKCLLLLLIPALALRISMVSAQPQNLSLEEIFTLADSCSKSLSISKLDLDIAQEEYRSAKASVYPDIELSVSTSYLGDGYVWDRDFKNGQSIDIPHFGNNFAFMATQVVYAGGAIRESINLAELSVEMSNLNLQNNRQEVRMLLAGNYLELYKICNQIKVVESNVELTDLLLSKMKSRLDQGTVLKNDIIRYELQLENLKLQKANLLDTKNILNHQLVTTLHLPIETEILPDTNIINREISLLSQEEWQSSADNSNIGLQQAKVRIMMSERQEKLARSEMLPKVAVVVSENLDGPITIEVPVLDHNFNYWYVGVGVEYNLSSLFKSNRKVTQAQIQKRQATEQYELAREQIDNALYTNYLSLQSSVNELKIQEKSLELANINYTLIENRFQNDLALITDMIDAGNAKLSAELDLLNNKVNLIYNYLKLKYITGIL